MSEQSKALQLADLIEWTTVQQDLVDAADELRRLHVVNADLLVALNRIAKWNEHTAEFALDYGSMGVRDFYRGIALEAIDQATGSGEIPSTQPRPQFPANRIIDEDHRNKIENGQSIPRSLY